MPGTHIICRQILDVTFDGPESNSYSLQTDMLDLCEHALLPALERLFERLTPTGEHWSIDQLSIDAGVIPRDGLDGALVTAVVEAMERQLGELTAAGRRDKSPDAATPRAGESEPTLVAVIRRGSGRVFRDAFVHFLETGLLPWWIQLPAEQSLETAILDAWTRTDDDDGSPARFAATLATHFDSPRVRSRLARQFTPPFLATLLTEISPGTADVMREVLAQLDRAGVAAPTEQDFIFQLWESAFAFSFAQRSVAAESLIREAFRAMTALGAAPAVALSHKLVQRWPGLAAAAPQALETLPLAIMADSSSPRRKFAAPAESPTTTAALDKGVFLRCAGVVLLHPFLPRLFEGLGIARNDQLLEPDRALGLLHFLATGHRTAPEYDLLLSKLLCGVPADYATTLQTALRPEDEEECEGLLKAVIRHWEALGNTSVDGLRGAYLVRPGKLSARGADFVLQVESRAYDILLDQLPWGIGLIKLPWMKSILWVEWRL